MAVTILYNGTEIETTEQNGRLLQESVNEALALGYPLLTRFETPGGAAYLLIGPGTSLAILESPASPTGVSVWRESAESPQDEQPSTVRDRSGLTPNT